ncbi:MAG: lysophospholipid acyltransferase family protein [Thermomicrobiales bacterium]
MRQSATASPSVPALRYPARKSALGELLIWLLVRSALRRMFVRVRLFISADDPHAAGLPLVAVANHPSWWDGYLALLLSRHFGLRRYLMMDAAQLRRYGFFTWAGCFGVARDDPRDVARAVAYAADCLTREENSLLWMFPQAAIVPANRRPVAVHGGAAQIVRRAARSGAPIGVVPVAWQLLFRGEQHPEVCIRTGPIIRFNSASSRDVAAVSGVIQRGLTETMDALADDLVGENLTAYRIIMRGQQGVNDRFDRLLHRARLVPDP